MEYDRVYFKPERQRDLRAMETWLTTVFRDRAVIEIACGTGYWTQFLVPVAAELLAIDASEETLAIARARVSVKHARFALGDAYSPPSGQPAYSGAFAGFWLSHVPLERMSEFLRGLHAILKPGARVVFIDNNYVEGSSTPISEKDSHGNTYQLRSLEDGSRHTVLKNFPNERDMRGVVESSAQHVKWHHWQYFWALEYVVR
jgi:demethylmenaquinone methyltransferase/2-methoxy-6-polyprenyl-1,4-benzoquinol methylase